MILRKLQEAEASGRKIVAPTFNSVRLLLRSDNMGFSFHITTIYEGTETPIWYKNHLEAVYCAGGEGEVETVEDGKVYPIVPGTMYALDKNDKHILRAKTEMTMICVFNPALIGKEVHDADGVYPLEADDVTT